MESLLLKAREDLTNDNNNQVHSFLVDAKEAGRLIGVSRSQFLALDKCGRLGPQSVNLGYGVQRQCRRWNVNELRKWTEHRCPSRREWIEGEKIKKIC